MQTFGDDPNATWPNGYVWDADAAAKLASGLRELHAARRLIQSSHKIPLGQESWQIVATGEVWHRLLDAADYLRDKRNENRLLTKAIETVKEREAELANTRAQLQKQYNIKHPPEMYISPRYKARTLVVIGAILGSTYGALIVALAVCLYR